MSSQKEKIRLSLDLSPEANAILEELAEQAGGTKSDVLRKAIVLIEVAFEAKKNGKKFGVVDSSGCLATEIVGL